MKYINNIHNSNYRMQLNDRNCYQLVFTLTVS